MNKDIVLRKALLDDSDGILELINLGRRVPKNKKWWNWFYQKGPFGRAIVWVAEYKKKIVAHRSFVPYLMQYDSNDTMACQAVDTIVHPQYRRMGIFSRLTEKALLEAKERKYSFIFNWPNQNSLHGYLKLGWKYIGKSPRYIRLFPQISQKFGQPSTDLIEHITFINKEIEGFLNDIAAQYNGIKKTSSYLVWRYQNNPVRKYNIFVLRQNKKVVGLVVLGMSVEKGVKLGNVLELLVAKNSLESYKKLLRFATCYFAKKNIFVISIFVRKSSVFKSCVQKELFFPYPINRSAFTTKMIDEFDLNFENWDHAQGDLDTY